MASTVDIVFRAQTEAAQRKIGQFLGSLSQGLSQGLGIGLTNQLLNQINRIPQAFENAIKRGVQFNSTIEDARLGIAAIIKQFDKTLTFDEALARSEEALDKLAEKAKTSPATLQELIAAFQGITGAATSANIPLQQQVDLIVLMSQALAGLGIRSEQILQESRALITGNINQDAAAAKILGITAEHIRNAREQGNLYEFLTGKLMAFSEAGERGAQNLTTKFSNLSDTADQTFGQVTLPLMDRIKEGIEQMDALLKSKDFVRQMSDFVDILIVLMDLAKGMLALLLVVKAVFFNLGALLESFSNFRLRVLMEALVAVIQLFRLLVDTIRRVGSEVVSMATKVGGLSLVLLKFATRDFVGAGREARKLIGENVEGIVEAITGNTVKAAAVVAGFINRTVTSAKEEASLTLDDIKREWQTTWDTLNGLFTRTQRPPTSSKTSNTGGGGAPATGPLVDPSETRRLLDQINDDYRRTVFTRLQLLDMEYEDRKDRLEREVKDEEEFNLYKMALDETYRRQRRQILDEESRARQEILFAEIQGQRRLIETDPDLSRRERKAALLPLLERELELLRGQLEINRERVNDPALNEEARIEAARNLVQVEEQRADVLARIRELQSDNFLGVMRQNLRALSDEWSAVGQNIAGWLTGSVQSAVRGVSDSIMGLITGTATWGQVFAGVARNIIANLIQVVVQWIAQMTIMRALQAVFGVATNVQAASAAAAWSPAATAASIATFGAASGVGLAAFLTAMATGTAFGAALSLPGRADGGPVDARQPYIVGERGPEIFVPNFNGNIIPNIAMPRFGRGAAGGLQAGGSGGAGGVRVVVVNDSVSAVKRAVLEGHLNGEIVQVVRTNRTEMGLPS